MKGRSVHSYSIDVSDEFFASIFRSGRYLHADVLPFYHEDGGDVPSKRRLTINGLRGITFKKKDCKILGFHGGDYEKWRLLGCYAV
jgi:hypothetical protein